MTNYCKDCDNIITDEYLVIKEDYYCDECLRKYKQMWETLYNTLEDKMIYFKTHGFCYDIDIRKKMEAMERELFM